MSEIPPESLDLILLSHMQQTRLTPKQAKTTQRTAPHPKVSERKIASVQFSLFGLQVCKKTYLFAHGVGEKRYRNLCKHFDANGVTTRIHKNTRKVPHNACSVEQEKQGINFIQTRYAVTWAHAEHEGLFSNDACQRCHKVRCLESIC